MSSRQSPVEDNQPTGAALPLNPSLNQTPLSAQLSQRRRSVDGTHQGPRKTYTLIDLSPQSQHQLKTARPPPAPLQASPKPRTSYTQFDLVKTTELHQRMESEELGKQADSDYQPLGTQPILSYARLLNSPKVWIDNGGHS